MMITANQISFSPNFLRWECSVRIDWLWSFELNYLEMRELESKTLRMKDFLELEKKWKTPKQFIKENIAIAYNNWYHDVKSYIQKLLNFLDVHCYEDKKKRVYKEEKEKLIEDLNNSELFTWEWMKNFNPDDRYNKQAESNLEKYSKQCRQEVKDLYKNSSPKKFSEELSKKLNEELDYDFVLEWISQLDKEDVKTWWMLIQNLSYELNKIYDQTDFDDFFNETHWHKYEDDYGQQDKISYWKDRDAARAKSLETVWKWIEMVEQRTWLLCCWIDWSWEFIDVEKIKKKFKWEIKSWMYIYSDWNWNLSEYWERWNKVGIISMSVFDGTNPNLSSKEIRDLRTYRLDRKLPKDFLFEWEDWKVKNYKWFTYDDSEDLSDLLSI